MANSPPDDDEQQEDTRSRALIALAVILALAIVSILLVRALRSESEREDCMMAGRTNCAPIEAPQRP